MGSVIVGSGVAFPPHEVTNADLARVMDTSDEWIRSRTGVARRRLVEPGVGSTALAAEAVEAALADAGVGLGDVDVLISATMTPDAFAPGNAPLIQHRAGLGTIAAYDIRQQCGGFLYGMELADAWLQSGRGELAVVVGAEAHAGYLPFGPVSWEILRGARHGPPDPVEYEEATAGRAWAVLFGDGAGAFVMRRGHVPDVGMLGARLFSDGSLFELIHVPGIGFTRQPYVDVAQLEAGLHAPHMNGMELFRQAVRLMPSAVSAVLEDSNLSTAELDLVVAHQANARIVEGVRKQLDLTDEVVPSNIADHGNTTAGTLPILYHEQWKAGAVGSASLVAFTAFGAGAHWGACLYRLP